MKNNFVLKVVEPGTPPSPTPTPTPVDPGTGVDPAVPNTGLFTHGIGGPEATIIGVAIILAIAAIVVAVLYRKHKKQGKVTKLVHLVDQTKAVIKSKKRVTAGLSAMALLASAGTLAVLLVNSGKSNTSAAEGDDELTVDISGNELTVEVGDEPVFAVAEVTATVAEATTSGYTLTAYTDNTDLVSTTDESSIVPMVTTDEGELVALAENTYGLSLVKPESKDEEVFATLSTDADNPTFITDKDYEATEANDTTTIYYGFYITPDTPYGTYTGSDIYYDVEENYTTTLTFDGNDSDGGEEMESITVLAGDSTTLPPNTYTRTGYEFVGWNTNEAGTGQAYTDGAEYTAVEGEFAEVILYAQWYKQCPANNICYRGNGASTATNMDNVEQYTTGTSTGKQVDLLASNFTKAGHGFVGWSEDKDAWTHLTEEGTATPTIYGPNQTITVGDLSEEGMKLYAIWAPAETSVTMQTFNPNSEPYASKTNGTVIALEDERDEEVYAVAKLADGNYWMIENLRLDNEPELSATNTHSPSLPLTNDDEDRTTSNYLSATSNDWCYFTWSDLEQDALCANQSKLNTKNVANTVASPTFSQDFTSSSHSSSFDSNIASYGNYYNWYSATAGNGKYETGSDVTVAGDICPAGWLLPYGGTQTSEKGGNTSGGFYYLDYYMNNHQSDPDTWRSFPNNFVYSGYWYGSSANGRGSDGYYWSSTAINTDGAYSLDFNGDSVGSGTFYSRKYNGYSVRCVAPVE